MIKSRSMRWAWHVESTGRDNKCNILVGRADGRRPLGRSRRQWDDNIKTDFKEVGKSVWIGLICLRIGTGGGPL
jgi:hypothetical protein